MITHADQIKGKKGEALREHLGDVIRNRRLNALVRDLDLELAPADLEAQSWDRAAGAHALRRPGVPGAARPAARVVGRPDEDDRRLRLRAARRGSGPARSPAGWPSTPAPRPAPASPCRAAGAPAPARSAALALAAADGQAAWVDATEVTPEDDAALAAWLADPARAKVLHDAKGPMLALAARGWPLQGLVSDTALAAYLVRPDQRSYDLADLTLRYLKRELKQGAADDGQEQLQLRRTRRRRRRRRDRDAARAGRARPGRGPRRRDRADRRHPAARRGRAAAGRPARRDGADRHRRRHRPPRVAGGALRRRGARRRRRGVRGDRQGDQPRLAQAAPGGALRRARHAEDQAHQDRLHHRRRRAAGRSTRRPSTRS